MTTFASMTSDGYVAIMDGATLYAPIPEGTVEFAASNYLSSPVRQAAIKSVAKALSAIRNHPQATMDGLCMDPCTASVGTIRFKDLVLLADFARHHIAVGTPVPLEARVDVSGSNQLSFCSAHPIAPRVCARCLYTAPDLPNQNVPNQCPTCYRDSQWVSAAPAPVRPPCPLPSFEAKEMSVGPLLTLQSVPGTFADQVKSGFTPPHLSQDRQHQATPKTPLSLIPKITELEKTIETNLQQALDRHHYIMERLENYGPWTEAKHKQCVAPKKLSRLESEIARLTNTVKGLQSQWQQCATPSQSQVHPDPAPPAPIAAPASPVSDPPISVVDPFADETHTVG